MLTRAGARLLGQDRELAGVRGGGDSNFPSKGRCTAHKLSFSGDR